MGIIAWIVLGLLAGVIAKALVPGRDGYGLVVTTLIGVGGALLGGFAATQLFHVNGVRGFFDLSTWVCAVLGAGVLLVVLHMVGANGGRLGRR